MVFRRRSFIHVVIVIGSVAWLSEVLAWNVPWRRKVEGKTKKQIVYVDKSEVERLTAISGKFPLRVEDPRWGKYLTSFDRLSTPRKIDPKDASVLATVAMLDDLEYSKHFDMSRRKVIDFVMHVRAWHKDNPYHNWMHGFAAGNFAYLLIKELHLTSVLGDHRAFALMIAAFCQDLGHPGTSSEYQVLIKSSLAQTFEQPSLLEKYHFHRIQELLGVTRDLKKAIDVLESLNEKRRREALETIETSILATDLNVYLKFMLAVQQAASSGIDVHRKKDKKMVIELLAIACDLSDQTKSFDNVRAVAMLISEEAFAQGVAEKKLGRQPEQWMDPERANVILDQRLLLEKIVEPVFDILTQIFPASAGLKTCLKRVRDNINHWKAFRQALKERGLNGTGADPEILNDRELIERSEIIYEKNYAPD